MVAETALGRDVEKSGQPSLGGACEGSTVVGLRVFVYMLLGIVATELLAAPFLAVFASKPELKEEVGQAFMPAGNVSALDALLNSLWLIGLVLVETTLLYLVFKYGRRFLRQLLLAVSAIPLVSITWLLLSLMPVPSCLVLISVGGLIVSVAVLVPRSHLYSGLLTVVMSAEISALLGYVLTPPTLFVLPLALSLYDVCTVLKGPLGAIASDLEPRDFGLLMFRVGERGLGAGDLVFYSIMTTAGLRMKGPLGALIVAAAVNLGAAATFTILRRYERPLPALPISMVLGVAALYLL
ncbi:MAG: hypothetical protein QW057_08675 [Candidatus Bathyarchaeia archaeon]